MSPIPSPRSVIRLCAAWALVVALLGSTAARAQALVLDLAGWNRSAQPGVTVRVPPGASPQDVFLMQLDPAATTEDPKAQLAELVRMLQRLRPDGAPGTAMAIESLPAAVGTWTLQQQAWGDGPRQTLVLAAVLSTAGSSTRVAFVSSALATYRQHLPAVVAALQRAQAGGTGTGTPAPAAAGPSSVLIGRGLPANFDVRRLAIADLAGLWTADTAFKNQRIVQTRKTNSFNDEVRVTTSVVEDHPLGQGGRLLRVQADGRYEYQSAFSLRAGCWTRTSHAGRAEMADGVLTLWPGELRQLNDGPAGCATGDRRTPGAPMRYRLDVAATQTLYGMPTYALWATAVGAAEPLDTLVRVESRPRPAQAPRPADLEAPTLAPGLELLGQWSVKDTAAKDDIDRNDEPYAAQLRLLPGGRYEMSVRRPNVGHMPLCRRLLVLSERGSVRQSLLRALPGDPRTFQGTLELRPDEARLNDVLDECGTSNTRQMLDLPAVPRAYRIRLALAGSGPRAGDQLFVGFQDRDDQHRTQWEFLTVPDVAGLEFGGYRRD